MELEGHAEIGKRPGLERVFMSKVVLSLMKRRDERRRERENQQLIFPTQPRLVSLGRPSGLSCSTRHDGVFLIVAV